MIETAGAILIGFGMLLMGVPILIAFLAMIVGTFLTLAIPSRRRKLDAGEQVGLYFLLAFGIAMLGVIVFAVSLVVR